MWIWTTDFKILFHSYTLFKIVSPSLSMCVFLFHRLQRKPASLSFSLLYCILFYTPSTLRSLSHSLSLYVSLSLSVSLYVSLSLSLSLSFPICLSLFVSWLTLASFQFLLFNYTHLSPLSIPLLYRLMRYSWMQQKEDTTMKESMSKYVPIHYNL